MVSKKIYKQPTLKVIELDSNDIICTSDLSTMGLYEDAGVYEENPGVSDDIWGTQW